MSVAAGDTVIWLGEPLLVTKVRAGKDGTYMPHAFWAGEVMFTWRSSLREYRAFGFPAATEACVLP